MSPSDIIVVAVLAAAVVFSCLHIASAGKKKNKCGETCAGCPNAAICGKKSINSR
jgi:hypothetical protein